MVAGLFPLTERVAAVVLLVAFASFVAAGADEPPGAPPPTAGAPAAARFDTRQCIEVKKMLDFLGDALFAAALFVGVSVLMSGLADKNHPPYTPPLDERPLRLAWRDRGGKGAADFFPSFSK